MKKLHIGGNIPTRLKQLCVYADDIMLVTRTKQAIINNFQKLQQEAIQYGLEVNQNKTKYMRHSRVQTNVKNKEIEIEGIKIEEGNSAKYLGTIMNAENLIEEEIKERIGAGNRSFFAHKKIFQSKLITRKPKERLYHTVIRPVVVYGSECWVLTENIKEKLLVFERRLLR